MVKSLNLFISYAHKDEAMKNELEKHLMVLRKTGYINIFEFGKLLPGLDWEEQINKELQKADIILLLISADYLASEFAEKELEIIYDRHMSGSALALPVIIRPCNWQSSRISELQVLPAGGKPVTEFSNRDAAYAEIVGQIERLTQTFERSPKWVRFIEVENKQRTGKLDLSGCDLSEIPEQVKQMSWLKELDLSSNQISGIGGLEMLQGLVRLELGNNQISKMEGINILSALQWLDLSGNKINKIDGLVGMHNLSNLWLPNNQIIKIEGLETLVSLKWLHLSSNQIKKIEGLKGLNNLWAIHLQANQIKKIEGLEGLELLKDLVLGYNQISKIEGLEMLHSLEILYIQNNIISTIEGLLSLKKLTNLDLSNNSLNRINGLFDFPKGLNVLQLFGNPVENISRTLFGPNASHNCLDDLKNLFAEEVEILVPEVKLILTGNSDVGKTKFSSFLVTGDYNASRNSTHGLEVKPLLLDKALKDDFGFPENTKITIWDFGGQEYFHNTHQLFFNQNAVYLFLWEKATNKNEPIQTEVKNDLKGKSIHRVLEHFNADYWLSNIRYFAPDAAILLVQNKVDLYAQNGEPLVWLAFESLQQYNCKNQYHISIAKTAEKDMEYWYDFQKLKYVLFGELKNFVSKNKEGKIYNEVRNKIDELRSVHYWKVEEFEKFINSLKANSPNEKAKKIDNRLVVDHFSRQGKLLFPTDQGLKKGNLIFTDPQWVSSKIYEILDDTVLQQNGFFDEKDLEILVKNKKFENKQILLQIIELMKQYNIVFYNPNKRQYIAPQYLPEVPTVHFSQVKKLLGKPKLVIKVDGFLSKSVINSIIATHAIKEDGASFYKYGAKTQSPNGTIFLVEIDYSEKKIYIYTDAPEVVYLRDVFTELLLAFNIKIENTDSPTDKKGSKVDTSVSNEVHFISETRSRLFISIDDDVFVNWTDLWNDHRSSEKDFDLDYCIAEDGNMVVRKMFAPFYLPYKEVRMLRTTDQSKPGKLFISYSSKNTDFMKRLVTHLEPLKRNATIELWYDRMIEPGTKWDDSIKQEMRKADVIIFLLSPDFIATNYIFEFEIPQAIKQFESTNSKLFFVELQACSWNRTVLSRFQQSIDPNADNKGVIRIENALNDAQWKKVIDLLEQKINNKTN